MRRNPRDSEPYVTLDGSLIYEVVRPEFSRIKTVSLAVAEVPPGESTVPHYHIDFDEVYWVLEGRGVVHVGSRSLEVHPEDCVEIPRGTVHWVENDGSETLRILCVCSPPYRHGTTVTLGSKRTSRSSSPTRD
ncbi:cupin domain-containing protein [Methanopyrus sp.]